MDRKNAANSMRSKWFGRSKQQPNKFEIYAAVGTSVVSLIVVSEVSTCIKDDMIADLETWVIKMKAP